MTVKEFCEKYKFDKNNVYNKLKRYRTELCGHISKEIGSPTELDEYAVNFLNEKCRSKSCREIIREQQTIIDKQAETIAEKDRQIKKIENCCRLLELKLANKYRENIYADKY